MKTLYVSDLDGTLLRSDATLSDFTSRTVNQLVDKGMLFSYATARSIHTSRKVTRGLDAKIPIIVYNGAMVIDNADGSVLYNNFFGSDVFPLLNDLFSNGVFPFVYSWIEGEEKFSFIESKCTRGMKIFLDSRKNDKRIRTVNNECELMSGDIYYITCIDETEKLLPLYEKYKNTYHCVFYTDIYTKERWLEILPRGTSKASAVKHLKELLNCDRLVVFGDERNDIDMFEIADEAYAVENAVDELKAIATDVIPSNDEDGVAKWMKENYHSDM